MSVEDVNDFLPSEDNREQNILRFTTNITRLAEGRQNEREIYVDHIENLQNVAALNNVSHPVCAPLCHLARRTTVDHVPLCAYLG